MFPRFALFAAALLASAALQARTPEVAAARFASVPLHAVSPQGSDPGIRLTAPPASAMDSSLLLDPVASDTRPRHAIHAAVGMALSTQSFGPMWSLGYSYRLENDFWIGGIVENTIYGLPAEFEIDLLEMNCWEMELTRWLAIRCGVGIGMAISSSGNGFVCMPMGRLTVQWAVRLGRVVSLTLSPFILGPSNIDLVYNWFNSRFIYGGEYGQLGLSFRF